MDPERHSAKSSGRMGPQITCCQRDFIAGMFDDTKTIMMTIYGSRMTLCQEQRKNGVSNYVLDKETSLQVYLMTLKP